MVRWSGHDACLLYQRFIHVRDRWLVISSAVILARGLPDFGFTAAQVNANGLPAASWMSMLTIL